MCSVSKATLLERLEVHIHGEHCVDVDCEPTISAISRNRLQWLTFAENEVGKHPGFVLFNGSELVKKPHLVRRTEGNDPGPITVMSASIWIVLRLPLIILHNHIDKETSRCQHPASDSVSKQLINDGNGTDKISQSAHL